MRAPHGMQQWARVWPQIYCFSHNILWIAKESSSAALWEKSEDPVLTYGRDESTRE